MILFYRQRGNVFEGRGWRLLIVSCFLGLFKELNVNWSWSVKLFLSMGNRLSLTPHVSHPFPHFNYLPGMYVGSKSTLPQ